MPETSQASNPDAILKYEKRPSHSMKEPSKPIHTKAIAAVTAILLLITLGTTVYHSIEGWSWLDSAYFTVITITTIGYGDMFPTHTVSKVFTMFFVFTGVGMFLFAISIIAERYFTRRVNVLERTVLRVGEQAQKAMSAIRTTQDNAKMSRRDYVKDMLIEHKKVSKTPDKEKKGKNA
ncbi:potassium channel family protein [Candidatus Woesearchaeota archaeon]|nr:potassium channel family protein [Candidatus Woesearchaeota archaeon]